MILRHFVIFVAPEPVCRLTASRGLRLDGWETPLQWACMGICCSLLRPCSFLSRCHLLVMLGLPT